MKVLGFAGSNSATSINKKLVSYVLQQAEAHTTELLDLNDYEVAIYSPERESKDGIPDKIMALAEKIAEADILIISLAEHNSSYSAAFKNVFDWMSRIPNRTVFVDKPLFLMATSPGVRGGQGVLEAAQDRFPRNGATILEVFSLPQFHENFTNGILSEPYHSKLKTKLFSVLTNH